MISAMAAQSAFVRFDFSVFPQTVTKSPGLVRGKERIPDPVGSIFPGGIEGRQNEFSSALPPLSQPVAASVPT